jgi:hypothetical protein
LVQGDLNCLLTSKKPGVTWNCLPATEIWDTPGGVAALLGGRTDPLFGPAGNRQGRNVCALPGVPFQGSSRDRQEKPSGRRAMPRCRCSTARARRAVCTCEGGMRSQCPGADAGANRLRKGTFREELLDTVGVSTCEEKQRRNDVMPLLAT